MARERVQEPDPSTETATTSPAEPEAAPAIAPGAQAILALQRTAGNAAATRALRRASSSPLPPDAGGASSVLGPAASAVRIERGPDVDVHLAARGTDALARTEGTTIQVGSRAPALDTPSGKLLLAHEAVHVRQQLESGDAATAEVSEGEADQAAVAATLGLPVGTLTAAAGPQYFEAGKHQATLTSAMAKQGFTDKEQMAAYFGNWCRDLSQILVPVMDEKIGHNAAFQVVNMMAIRKFGHGVTPSQLGAYATPEHIDNPAGTTDKDIIDPKSRTIAGYSDAPDPITGKDQNVAGTSGEKELEPKNVEENFKLNEAGIPAYIGRSKEYVMKEFDDAAKAGRTEAGLYHLGNLSHTCEDLFAHSNWVEIAVGRLIGEGAIPIPKEVAAEVEQRQAAGLPPVEDYAAQAVDKAGKTRPILSTGTFTGSSGLGDQTGHDTFISIGEQLKDIVEDLDPFKETGEKASEWDFVLEILNHMDAAGDEGSLGPIMLGVLEPVIGTIDEQAAKLTSGVDNLQKDARDTFGEGTLGDLASGAAGLVSSGVHTVVDPSAAGLKEGFKALITAAANSIGSGGVSLAKIAVWIQKEEGELEDVWKSIKDGVKKLPKEIEAIIFPKLVEAERAFKKEVRKLGSAMYHKAVQKLLGDLMKAKSQTKVADTSIEKKYNAWAEELSKYMQDKLVYAGGQVAGGEAAAHVPPATPDEKIPELIDYAEHRFAGEVKRIALDAQKAGFLADEKEQKKFDTQIHQLQQISNVPDWARAGASHSQMAKDHATSPFFGLAFAVANAADNTITEWMKKTWGNTGPAPGLEGDFGEKEMVKDPKTGKMVQQQKVDEDGRPVLKDEEGLSDWEKEARKKFLETRAEGDATIEQGVAPEEKIGPALIGIADRLVKLVQAYPVLGPVFDATIAKLRSNPADAEMLAELDDAEKRWEDHLKSGELDDAVMEEVDRIIAAAKNLVGSHADEAESQGDGDTHTQEQIANLNQFRGANVVQNAKGKFVPVAPKHRSAQAGKGVLIDQPADPKAPEKKLNQAVGVHDKAKIDVDAEKIKDPRKRFEAEVERIFSHPYDSNWWVPIVQGWASRNERVLGQYIHDRNSGKSEVH
jgi:hypothetical protein